VNISRQNLDGLNKAEEEKVDLIFVCIAGYNVSRIYAPEKVCKRNMI